MNESIALKTPARIPSEDTVRRAHAILENRLCTRVQAMQNAEQQRAREIAVVVELRRELTAAEAALDRTEAELKTAREKILSNNREVCQSRHKAEKATNKAKKDQTAQTTKAEQTALARKQEVEKQTLAAVVEFAAQRLN